MNNNRVVVTGLGVISPNGIGKDKFWESILTGKSGISKITHFDITEYPTKIAGFVNDFNPCDYMEKKRANLISRFAQFSLAAAKMAIEDSGLDIENEDKYNIGIALGTAIGGFEIGEKACAVYYTRNLSEINPFSSMAMNPNSALGLIAVEFKIKGLNMTISTGCSAGLSSIGYAYDIIKSGRADIMVTGGAEAPVLPVTFSSFCSANVLTKKNDSPVTASRPFDKYRDGYVLGEGAGIVILESLEHALRRKANVYAEIIGYGVTNDGYSMFKMEPSGKEVSKTIRLAMENAGIMSKDVNYINAHGSSSIISDKRETTAIKNVFEDYAYEIPISSIKSMIGQSLAATASLQFVTSALVVHTDHIPPTINYEDQDPECDLDYVPNKSRNGKKINIALINSFGAGGNNISMLIKKYKKETIQ